MKKKITVMVMIFALILAGCETSQGNKKEEKKIVIAVSVISETHNWPIGVLHYAEEEVKKIAKDNNWDYRFCIAADTNEQSNQVIELVREKVDCIIMLPMDGASLKTAAMTVQSAGIPLVLFDREIPDFAPTATIKGDNTGIGSMTADIFNGMFPDGAKILEIMGDTSTVPQQRTDGFDETIHDNFIKEQVGYTNWQREDSKDIFLGWVREQNQEEIAKVEAIFTHDDEIALGVLDALDYLERENPKEKKFDKLKVIAGSAGDKEFYKRIMEEDKYILFSLTYRPDMVADAIRIGEKIIKEQTYAEITVVPTFEINAKNVKEFYNPDSPY